MKRPLNVILLEDSRSDAEIIQRLLLKERGDCEFRLATNKKTFLLALEEFLADVILSDNSLPGFNATAALKITRQHNLNIPFILITGTVSEEYAANIIKQGADDYILKDRMTRLPAAIDAALKQRRNEKEKQETTEKLIQSEAKYRTIFFKSPLPKWIYDAETFRFLDVNEAAILHYGYTPKEFLSMTIKDIRPKEDLEEFLTDNAKVKEGTATRPGNRRHLKKNGELIIVETKAHSIEYNNRKAIMVVANDITQKIKAEQALQTAYDRLSFHIENTPLGFIEWDQHLQLKYWSKRCEEIFGWTQTEFISLQKNGYSPVYEEDAPLVSKIAEHLITGKVGRNCVQNRNYTKDGRVIWCEWFNSALKDKEGNVITLLSLVQDITERKQAEEDLRQSEIRLKEAQAVGHISNWEVDIVQNIHTWSDEFYRIYGLNKAEVQPSAELFLSFMHPDDADFAQKKVAESFISFGNSSFSFRFIRKDGEARHGYAEWKFEFDKKGNPVRLFGILQDITERKEAEEELKKLETDLLEQQKKEQVKITATALEAQEKERHAIGIELHDNVNQILVGTSLMLSLGKSDPKKAQEMIGIAMNNLQEAILENRKIAHVFVAPDLETETLLDQLKKLVQNMLETSGLQTDITITKFRENLLDSGRKINIYRIAQEQCTNIVKYAHATTVDISLTTADDLFKMTIADNGIGMDSSKKTTGIGLKNINGRLSIFNGTANIITAPGKGFTLEITIPLEG
jgi:PAS domain S-box-containing protein